MIRPLQNLCYHWAAVGNTLEHSWSIYLKMSSVHPPTISNNAPGCHIKPWARPMLNFWRRWALRRWALPIGGAGGTVHVDEKTLLSAQGKKLGLIRSKLGKLWIPIPLNTYLGTYTIINHDFCFTLDLRRSQGVLSAVPTYVAPPSEVLVLATFLALWQVDVSR